MIRKLEIEVKNHGRRSDCPLDYVSVKIKRGWHRAYLGVGSNMGDRMEYINQAINAIEVQDDTRVVHVSSLIETKPYGGVVQDDFLNGCIAIDTLKEPEELLDFLMDVEAQAGRVRTIHWGPRTLDLDILMYDDLVMNERRLTIPHKEMHKRLFVLEPLEEIRPISDASASWTDDHAIKRKDKRGTVTYERFDGDKAADRSDRSENACII